MPTEALLDSRFAALPRLIRDATNPNPTTADIRRFMATLLQADPALFSGALHFFSREGHGFVPTSQIGAPEGSARTWPRWPLRRLFAARRASLITNPVSGAQALAVPFNVGLERHVVVAPLSVQNLDEAQQTFLDALQSAASAPPLSATVTERVPRFVWLGMSEDLAEVVGGIVRRRAWPLLFAPTFGHALMMLEDDRVDIAVLEARALNGELNCLRALRHAAKIGDAPIVYFSDTAAGPEVQTLVDCILPQNAGDGEILRALKTTAALVSRMRGQALGARVERIEDHLRACADYPELAEACAHAALHLGADAVSVMLADRSGGVHAAHVPLQTVLGDHWPTPFMTGESITHTRADDAFYEDAFDDGEYAQRLRELHPVSAAALPIASGAQIVGSMLAFSTRQPMFQPEFDALADLCERTGHALVNLREPRIRGPWRRAMLGQVMLEAFEGARARASFALQSDGVTAAVVVLEPQNDRRAAELAQQLLLESDVDLRQFAAACKGDSRGIALAVLDDGVRLRYACEGLPVPLRVPLSGPIPASRRAESCEAGSFMMDANCVTLIYSSEFASQIEPAKLVGALQRGLRASRAMVARSLPRLAQSTQKLGFACITMLSSDVAPHPQALV